MTLSLRRPGLTLVTGTIVAMAVALGVLVMVQDRSSQCRALSIDPAAGIPRLDWGRILTKEQELDCLRQIAARVGRDRLPTWLETNGFRASGARTVAAGQTVISGFYPNRFYRRPKAPTWHWFLSHGQLINFIYFDSALAPRITSRPIFL